ncbi:Nsp1-like C-terminal region-domain-containing protein [Russula emetica]|nr:Nsp1-like C-terminal region-domain-containing protein [Russula emetica]
MSSNFGTGQGLFGNNQNRNQGAAAPGSTPAAGTSAFGGLGSNTTNSSAFGGAGAGNTPGGGGTASAPTGSVFGTGGAGTGGTGSLFGGGPSLFAANPASNTGSTAPATGGPGLFANASSNPGTSGTTAGQGLFGNTTGATAGGGTGGPLFGFPKPAAASGASPFALNTGASTGTSGSGGNLFPGSGNSNATGSTTAAPTGTSTNSSTLGGGGLFGNSKPADSAAKPATSSFFSAPTTGGATSTGTTATGNTSSMFSNLAAKPSETSTSMGAPPSTQPQAGGNAFRPLGMNTVPANQSGFTLGGSAATGDKAASTTAAAGGGLFGNIGAAANKDGEKKGGISTAPSTFSLGGQPTETATGPAAPTTEKKDGVAAPSLFSGLGGATSGIAKPAMSLGGSSSSTTSGTQPFPTTTTSAISVAPPSMLKGKSIEEIINRWSTELEMHVRDFNKFASEVAVWDRSLIENGNNLAALYSHVLAAEREQNDIDQSLDHIEQQEKELIATVEIYEKQMSDILGGQSGTLRTLDTGPADTERDKNYMLATELHNHLDDLSSSLTQLIDSVNSMSMGQNDTKRVSADDPMAQIAHVLSNHLESLQWIDGASRDLEEKVVEVEKRIKDVGTSSPALGGGSRSRGFGLVR